MKHEIMIFSKFNKFKLYPNDKSYLARHLHHVSRNGELYAHRRATVYDAAGRKSAP
ncbi:MAG: hypothetical protein Altm2KO_28890 [Alteromonas macleodii]